MNVEVAHAANPELGYVGGIAVRGHRVWAVGGQWSKPTMLQSDDGGTTFSRPPTAPKTSGLRDVWLDDDCVWVVGENGIIARSDDEGHTWTIAKEVTQLYDKLGTRTCLYAIERDPAGMLWVSGDNLLLKSKAGKRWLRVPTDSDGRMLALCRDPRDPKRTWLVDSDGVIQRWNGKKFARVAAKAMRVKRPLCQLARTPSGALIVIGDGGLILRSANDGATWTKIPHLPLVDYERLLLTPYGLFVVGDDGTLVVSYDDGRRFETIATPMTGHLWSIAQLATGVLVSGERGALWRISTRELALVMKARHPDPLLRDLAARVAEGDPLAIVVLEDALRERAMVTRTRRA